MFQSGRDVEGDAKLCSLGIGALEILSRPVLVFSNELNFLVACFGDLFETLLKWQLSKYGPQHDGEIERNARHRPLISRRRRGDSVAEAGCAERQPRDVS